MDRRTRIARIIARQDDGAAAGAAVAGAVGSLGFPRSVENWRRMRPSRNVEFREPPADAPPAHTLLDTPEGRAYYNQVTAAPAWTDNPLAREAGYDDIPIGMVRDQLIETFGPEKAREFTLKRER